MKCFWSKIKLNLAGTAFLVFMVGVTPAIFAQQGPAKSQEVSEIDGQPVLIKHLPDHERVQVQAVFATEKATLVNAVGHQALFDVVQFSAGTEAVTAAYPQGQLVIIEFTNPQSSVEADSKIQEHLSANPQAVVYRRIGNYNAFVLDASDAAAANTLLDEIKYQKTVQWLGEDPFLLRKLERYMMSTSRDIAISTVLVILLGLGASVIVGIAAGFIFFRFRDQKRAGRAAFSDAGGLTRLNLDGLTSETLPK